MRKFFVAFAATICLSAFLTSCDAIAGLIGGGDEPRTQLRITNSTQHTVTNLAWGHTLIAGTLGRDEVITRDVESGRNFVHFEIGGRSFRSWSQHEVQDERLSDFLIAGHLHVSSGNSSGALSTFISTTPEPDGRPRTTLTIVNESEFEVTHVQWGNYDFTSGANPILGVGRSETLNVAPGVTFVRFRPRLNPFNLRTEQAITIVEGQENRFVITRNTNVVRLLDNTASTLATVAEAQLRIGDTGPGGGTIFSVSGGVFWEVSGELGMSNWAGAATGAGNHEGGGFSDWVLPASAQLSLIRDNLHSAGLGYLHNERYWGARTAPNATTSHFIDFGTGTIRAYP